MKPLTAPFGTDDSASWEKDRDKFSPDKEKVTGPRSQLLFIPLISPLCHHLSCRYLSLHHLGFWLLGWIQVSDPETNQKYFKGNITDKLICVIQQKLFLFNPFFQTILFIFIMIHRMISLSSWCHWWDHRVFVLWWRLFSVALLPPQVSPDGVSDQMEGLTMTSKYKRVWVNFLSARSLWCHCWIKAWRWHHSSSGALRRRLLRLACPSCWVTATWRRRRHRLTTITPVRDWVCTILERRRRIRWDQRGLWTFKGMGVVRGRVGDWC